jgi:hypothetical protein
MWPPLAVNEAISRRCLNATAGPELSPDRARSLPATAPGAIRQPTTVDQCDRQGVGPRGASQDFGPARFKEAAEAARKSRLFRFRIYCVPPVLAVVAAAAFSFSSARAPPKMPGRA